MVDLIMYCDGGFVINSRSIVTIQNEYTVDRTVQSIQMGVKFGTDDYLGSLFYGPYFI